MTQSDYALRAIRNEHNWGRRPTRRYAMKKGNGVFQLYLLCRFLEAGGWIIQQGGVVK